MALGQVGDFDVSHSPHFTDQLTEASEFEAYAEGPRATGQIGDRAWRPHPQLAAPSLAGPRQSARLPGAAGQAGPEAILSWAGRTPGPANSVGPGCGRSSRRRPATCHHAGSRPAGPELTDAFLPQQVSGPFNFPGALQGRWSESCSLGLREGPQGWCQPLRICRGFLHVGCQPELSWGDALQRPAFGAAPQHLGELPEA